MMKPLKERQALREERKANPFTFDGHPALDTEAQPEDIEDDKPEDGKPTKKKGKAAAGNGGGAELLSTEGQGGAAAGWTNN